MSLSVSISLRAEQDMTLQYRWYFENASADVAERWLLAVHETISRIALQPDVGMPRRFAALELAGLRSMQVRQPFHRHLLFYKVEDQLLVIRLMHGSRDIPRRLLEESE